LRDSDYLETSVTLHDRQDPRAIEPDGLGLQSAHSGGCSLQPGYDKEVREGSTVWTA